MTTPHAQLSEDAVDALRETFTFAASLGQQRARQDPERGSKASKSTKASTKMNAHLLKTIGKEQLRELLRLGGEEATDDELEKVLALQDMDKNGTIEFSEFLTRMAKKQMEEDENEPEKMFDMFDEDGDSRICVEDLMGLMESVGEDLSEEECRAMLDFGCRGGEEDMSFDDFMHILAREDK